MFSFKDKRGDFFTFKWGFLVLCSSVRFPVTSPFVATGDKRFVFTTRSVGLIVEIYCRVT